MDDRPKLQAKESVPTVLVDGAQMPGTSLERTSIMESVQVLQHHPGIWTLHTEIRSQSMTLDSS